MSKRSSLPLVTWLAGCAAAFGLHTAIAQETRDPPKLEYRVVGGTVAADGAWPWQVAIYVRLPSGMFGLACGGTLVSQRWILSAAHCFFGSGGTGPARNASDLLIVEATNQIDNPRRPDGGKGRVLEVKSIVAHQGFRSETGENDIALIELATPARSAPVALAGPAEIAFEAAGRTIVITGWGTTRAMRVVAGEVIDVHTSQPVRPGDPGYFTDRLMEVELPLVDGETCRRSHLGSQKVIDERHICAGLEEGGKDSCQGDSGGPLVARDGRGRFVQVGIISWGRACGLPRSYGVNTRVAAFESWVRSTIGIAAPAPEVPPPPVPPPPPRPPGSAPPPDMPIDAVAQGALLRDNPAGLTVEIVQGDVLRIGQMAQFRVTTRKPGHLVLIDMTPDGKMTQIFPNARSLATPLGRRATANLIEPDRPLLVPDRRNPYEGFEMKVDPPTGRGVLVGVLTERPVQVVPVPDRPKAMERLDAVDYLGRLADEFNRDLAVRGPSQPRGWSIVMMPYRVHP